MFASLRTRLWLTYALLTGVILAILSISLVVYLARNPAAERETFLRLSVTAESLTRVTDINLDAIPTPRLADLIRRSAERTGLRILAVASNGTILLDSANANPQFQVPTRALSSGRGVFIDEGGTSWYFASRNVGNGSLVVAAPRPRPIASIMNALVNIVGDELLRPFIQSGIIALVLALVLAFLMARWIARPLQTMAGAAQSITDEQPQTIPLTGPREVQELARSFNDMTDRVQASQQSQRDFVANVSHELKTPLTSIQGFAQAMLDGTAESEAAIKQSAEVIFTESSRMDRLVNDLLDLARMEGGTLDFQRAPVDLNLLLENLMDGFSPQAHQASVTLDSRLGQLPLLIGDSDRLAQVFTNLVDNAIKFTPPGGAVTVQSDQIGEWVRITVSDDGPGIPAKELPRIFERFYQLDKSRAGGQGRGVGLGLPIAHEIVLAHGGRITAHSKVDQGSVFFVELPLSRPDDSTLVSRTPTDP
jgi:signal transduction histidine kinase